MKALPRLAMGDVLSFSRWLCLSNGESLLLIAINPSIQLSDTALISFLWGCCDWHIERLFQVLDQCFRGEINTLAYPRAALFGFCMALICYNLLAVLKAALRTVHGADKIEAGLSPYYLADEIRRVHDGLMIAIPPTEWLSFAQLDLDDTAQLLKQLAMQIELSKFRSHPRGQKKKVPKPKYDKKKPHVSTARLLAKAKAEKKAP